MGRNRAHMPTNVERRRKGAMLSILWNRGRCGRLWRTTYGPQLLQRRW